MLTCDKCHTASADVQCMSDPYNSDVNNEIVEINLCDACYRERVWDI